MTSDTKSAANRENARKSTGPRTDLGKARVARNAMKHGLNTPVMLDQEFAPRVETLAQLLAGASPSAARQLTAKKVAMAQVDLERVREARFRIFTSPLNRKPRLSTDSLLYLIGSMWDAREEGKEIVEDDRLIGAALAVLEGQEVWSVESGEGMDLIASALLKLERYEKAAWNRLKFAIRELERLEAVLDGPQATRG